MKMRTTGTGDGPELTSLPDALAEAKIITILTSAGPNLTKVWDSSARDGGQIRGYENALQVQVHERVAHNMRELSALLSELEQQSKSCIIRGRFIGHEAARGLYESEIARDAARGKKTPMPREGYTLRRKAFFKDRRLHYFFVDIDGFLVEHGVDPVTHPVEAILQFIRKHLPVCFEGVSFHWQLSSGAGHPKNAGVLKAHVTFWLQDPYLGEELEAWVKAVQAPIDTSVFRCVQPNYTAAPVFVDGAVDPVPQRSGFYEGWSGDEVPLVIEEAVLQSARGARRERSEMVDPRGKPGLIGLFHRVFTVEDVIERWLEDVFEFSGTSSWRLNFLKSTSGAAEGAVVCDNRMGIYNSHDSDPFRGRAANLWDLVRVYRFGHLDDGLDAGEKALLGIGSLPSQEAMVEMVRGLPEIEGAVKKEADAAASARAEMIDELMLRVELCMDAQELEKEVAAAIAREAHQLSDVEASRFASAIQARAKEMGVKVPINVVRGWLRQRGGGGAVVAGGGGGGGRPEWIDEWVYITNGDKFFNIVTKNEVTSAGFCAMFNQLMPPRRGGGRERADRKVLDEWGIDVVNQRAYVPSAGPVFEMLGNRWVNLYRPGSAPEMPVGPLTEEQSKAVETVKRHLEMLFPDQRERELFISWMAFCVRNPGIKIRWVFFIRGVQGDGKSFFVQLLGAVMGAENVKTLDAKVLESNFTGWSVGAALIAVEEIKLHGHNRWDVINSLKPMITNDTINVHPKNKEPYQAPNTTNYILLSNHADGIPAETGDRRYTHLATSVNDDQAKALTDSGYFEELFKALDHPGALRQWLMSVPLHPEFDPNGRAPMTETKIQAVGGGKSELELAVEDALEDEVFGVRKDAFSTEHMLLAVRLAIGNMDLEMSKIIWIFHKLGFRWLGRGRAGTNIQVGEVDKSRNKGSARVRLWIKQGIKMNFDECVEHIFSERGDDFLA